MATASPDLLKPLALSAGVAFAAQADAAATDKRRQFSSIPYSGGVITDHPLLPRCAFDLSSTRMQKEKTPVLFDHKHAIGTAKATVLSDKITATGTIFDPATDEHARNVLSKADQGFDWEQSVGIWPGKVQHYKAGEKVPLNGQVIEGPVAVFCDNRIREFSFLPLGADAATNSHFFSIGGERVAPAVNNEAPEMEQAEIDALKAAAAEATTLKASLKEATDQLAAVNASAAAAKLATRTEAVKGLFKAIGKEFNDANAAPYVAMSDESFAAASEAISSRAKLDPSLTQHTATGGEGGQLDKTKPRSILAAAKAYQAQQFKIDQTVVPIDEAVIAVNGQITL